MPRFFVVLCEFDFESAHVGVAPVGGGDEGFLDGSGGDPAFQVEPGTGFVVGSRCAAASEGLLADDGSGGLVVDVEIAGGVDKDIFG